MRVVWIAVRRSPTCFLVEGAGGEGVFPLGPQCPTKPEDSGETWTSRGLQREHLGGEFPRNWDCSNFLIASYILCR